MLKLTPRFTQWLANQRLILAISVVVGGLITGFFYIPAIFDTFGIATLLLPLVAMVIFLIMALSVPNNHTDKFITSIFIGLYSGVILPLLFIQNFIDFLGQAFGIGLLFFLFYGVVKTALNPDNFNKKFRPLLFGLGCLSIGWLFSVMAMLQAVVFFGTVLAGIMWVFQWFLTPISHKILLYKIGNVLLMLACLLEFTAYQQQQIKQNADIMLAQVLAFKQKTGNYPNTDQAQHQQIMRVLYRYDPKETNSPDTPFLSYYNLRDPYCRFNYDFAKMAWNNHCTD